MNNFDIFSKGLLRENPVFVSLLGMCPVLAITTSMSNAIGMGAAVTVVLVMANIVISLIRKLVPNDIRIPVFIVIIAGFVTMIELVMNAYVPAVYESLGIFIPLIVVNCIILARVESFASKNKAFPSILDALGMGIGFAIAVSVISLFREIIGSGEFFGYALFGAEFKPALIMILPPGAFITLGFILAFLNMRQQRKTS